MDVMGAAARPTTPGPAEWFTGQVWLDEIAAVAEPGLVRALRVHFTPGARTAWHVHPLGQILHIVDGVGRVQGASGGVREVRAGDTVVVAPGERHWHGAAPGHQMCHIAIQERDPGTGEQTLWHEPVSDADYLASPAAG
jgi:quercetin dioxygenase-like cupin family protein